ncbi:MAG: hypothetical protein ACI8P3_000778 [Saprospiraceae bacterium]|jgi:hypothetical protein
MKQLLILLAVLSSFPLFSQKGTTLEEYRYLSKGYVYQLEMGLDAQKEGYLIKNLFKSSKGAQLVGLYQIGIAEPKALLVVLEGKKDKATYVCLANGTADERVRDLAKADQRNLSDSQQSNYQNVLTEFLFEALSNPDLKVLSYQPAISAPTRSYQNDETLVSRSANLEQYIQEAPKVSPIKQEVQMTNVGAAEKSLSGNLATRTIIQSADAYADTKKKGTIAIKICVDMEGNVTSAKFTQRGSTTFDSYLKKVATKAAKSIKFAKLDAAEQCGIVNYKF